MRASAPARTLARGGVASVAALLALLVAAPLADAAPPDPAFTLSPETLPGAGTVTANATGATDPDGGAIVRYEWSVADGPFRRGNATETFAFNGTGYYGIRLRVTDAQNETSTSGTRYVVVGTPPDRPFFDVRAFRHFPLLLRGAIVTIELAVLAILLGLPIGIVVALGRISRIAPVRWASTLYVEILRGSPLVLQIVAWFLVPPVLTQALNARWDWVPILRLDAFEAGLLALLINTSAYQAEIIRAGIQAIPTGQTEAALSLGMTRGKAMRHVVLPQAFRLIAPPMTNEFIVLLKDTSLVTFIGLTPPELFGTGRNIMATTYEVLEILVAVGIVYIAMTWSLSVLLRKLEKRYRIPGLGVTP